MTHLFIRLYSNCKKVSQKVTHLYIIGGFRGHFPPNQMYFGMDIQNAYLAEDRGYALDSEGS